MIKKSTIKNILILAFLLSYVNGAFSQAVSQTSIVLAGVSLNKNGFCFGRPDTLNMIPQEPSKIYCADFDMDNINDLMVNNYLLAAGSGTIFFHKGTTSGTFSPVGIPLSVPPGNGIKDFCVADFNKDSKIDIATIDEAGRIWFFKNLSTGTINFSAPSFSTTINGISLHPSIEAADVDNNTYPDLVIAQPSVGVGMLLAPLINTISTVSAPFSFSMAPTAVAFQTLVISTKPFLRVGFFDSDLLPDVVVGERNIGSKLEAYYNLGSPNYYNPSKMYPISITGNPFSIKVVKLNADNFDDIVVLTRGGSVGLIKPLLSNGTFASNFNPQPTYSANNAFDFEITDFNNDGLLDLCTTDTIVRGIRIAKGLSASTPFFSTLNDLIDLSPIGTGQFRITSKDIDKNTYSDLIVFGYHPTYQFPTVTILNHSFSPTITVSGFLCPGGQAVLTASLPITATGYSWLPSTGSGSGNTYTVSSQGSYTAIATFPVTGVESCTMSSKPAVVTLTTAPTIKAFSTPGNTLCVGSSFAINSTGTYAYYLVNSAQTQTTIVPTSTVSFPPITATGSGTFVYVVLGFDINTCSDTDYVTVQVFPNPVTNICSNCTPTICAGQPISIYVIPNMPNCSFLWNPGGIVTSTLTVSPLISSNYNVTFQEPIHGCKGIDAAYVTVVPAPVINYSVVPKELCAGKASTISMSGGSTYTWSSGQQSSSITFTPATGFFVDTVVVVGGFNCRTKIPFNLMVNDKCTEIVPYNILTPNGDGQNDIFYIDNIEAYRDNVVKIYSRWGQELASIPHYDNTNNYWAGTMNNGSKNEPDIVNQNLPSGTYFYVIDLGDHSPLKKGYIELIKK